MTANQSCGRFECVKTKRYPSDLTDHQWEITKKLLPAPASTGRRRTLDLREVINAIFYIVVGGVQWRMLPRDFPCWQSVYFYFGRWRDDGTWKRIHDTLRAQVRLKSGRHKHPSAGSLDSHSLDSQSVKTGVMGGERGFDGGQLIKGRKRHVLVDTLGLVLEVIVTSAQVSDPAGARLLLSRLSGSCKKLRRIWVDGTYRGSLLSWAKTRIKAVITPVLRKDKLKEFVLVPKRWVSERTFAWLYNNRRLSKDYERQTASNQAMIHIAMTRIMLRRL